MRYLAIGDIHGCYAQDLTMDQMVVKLSNMVLTRRER